MATLTEPAAAVLDDFPQWSTGRMWAIAFDLDTGALQTKYGTLSWQNAYRDIRDALRLHGFTWQQGSVQFGGPDVTPVTCALAVQELKRGYPWFAQCIRDIRMLRIEESSDLKAALDV